VIDGPAGLVADAVRRLEVICDTYLSVGTPVQRALPALIERTSDLRRDIHARVRGNLLQLRAGLTGAPACDVPRVEGGWSAVVRVPAIVTEEDMVLRLLDHHGVMVHPGFFFDFSAEAFLVVSLLPAPETFGHGVEAVASTVHGLLPR
jgi:aspartate/methionine/tyrosine aminotransferase